MNNRRRSRSYDFTRYLASKAGLDDRSLNAHVQHVLAHAVRALSPDGEMQILELGAGIGTMVERIFNWGLLANARYTALDLDPGNLELGRERLRQWARDHSYTVTGLPDGLGIKHPAGTVQLTFDAANARDLIRRKELHGTLDWIIAHAFMDLVDLDATLSTVTHLLKSGGLLYLTHTFDGMTRFLPVIDRQLDAQIEALYHQSMDDRIVDGLASGDSRAGSRLLALLPGYGFDLIAAGASDWVVHPEQGAYRGDEAYFLHHIIHTIDQQLGKHPDLDRGQFQAWVDRRHRQVESGELIYIAHQIDLLGRLG